MNIVFKGSPNYSRRYGAKIDRIVIHWFGIGTLESANNRFQIPAEKSSAHYGISKGRIWQWVKEENAAWHSGKWLMNRRSVGIEHDATLDHDLSEKDYVLSGELVAQLAKFYNIPLNREHIRKHSEVKATRCPGTIDIDKIIKTARGSSMTNVKRARYRFDGEEQWGWFLPDTTPDAHVSHGKNYGVETPIKADGSPDWSRIKPEVDVVDAKDN